ncbi:MAG: arginine deiminase-related protein [Candidatus Omnitrophota bacterium]|nr:arginine deiminase-related protein [Candidatus Omnitrophota bacterium]
MCRPTHYTIAYEINPWMSRRRQVAPRRAMAQWQALHGLLTERLKVAVALLPPVNGLPDLPFTANAGLVAGRTFIRSNFRHPERQGEEPVTERYFKRLGLRVVTLPRSFNFEGEGDALWCGENLFLGFRFRSDATTHEHLARILHCRALPLELIDKRFYHLDTCFCPLNAETALWFPHAFDRYGRRVIERYVREPIAVSEADALKFCCNVIVASRSIVLHRGISTRLTKTLAKRGFDVHELDLSEFLKAGGSAKCLALRLT